MDLTEPLELAVPGVQGRVLTVLARSGLPLTGKRIADMAGTSVEGTRQVLLRLATGGLVTAQRVGSAIQYELNERHLLAAPVRQLVHEADQAVWTVKRRISASIEEVLDPGDAARVTGALFGSVARGSARPDSDVDALLVTPDELTELQVESLVAEVIRVVEAATGNDCNVLQLSRTRFDALVRDDDPMVASLTADAASFHGPDVHRRLRGEPWDALETPLTGTPLSGLPHPAQEPVSPAGRL